MKIRFLVLMALIGWAVSCLAEGASSIPVNRRAIRVYTVAELDKLIRPGMTIAEITNQFGLPFIATGVGSNPTYVEYTFPIYVPPKPGQSVIGFGIHLRKGKVWRWDPSTTVGSPSEAAKKSFQLFIVNEKLTNLVNTVDTTGSAVAEGLTAPDLTFQAVAFAGRDPSGKWPMILVLDEGDWLKLKKLAESNAGRRMLVVYQNQVISAPFVAPPSKDLWLQFDIKDAAIVSYVMGY